MEIGIVGLGYWGNIILKNLISMGNEGIKICDLEIPEKEGYEDFEKVNEYKNLECDYVFITTPTTTHFEICKHFLEKGVNVFCEKPLTISTSTAKELYDLALDNETVLFTDWIFTFNSHIETIKKDYDNGKLGNIKSVFMNRLNLGPERFDVNARWDLASHDVSIIQYLFAKKPKTIQWTDYKRKKDSQQDDSCLGLIEYEKFVATINASWQYRKKVRECVFEFENYFVVWDDYKKFLQYEDASNISFPVYSGNLSYPCSFYEEPLKKSINRFFNFSREDILKQKELTLQTIQILEGN